MSIFHPASVTCATCGTKTDITRTASLNADRRPDLRSAVLDGSFQAETCPKCGTRIRLQPHFTYLDMRRGQWILVEPAELIEGWKEAEAEARLTWDRSFGPDAPPEAREIGEGMKPRLVFGWPALREKLLCSDLDLDDVTLELLKLAVLSDVPKPPLGQESELRLLGGDAATLELGWVIGATEERLVRLPVPRAAYDDIIAEPDDWEAARDLFDGAFLVDLKRMISGP